MKKDCNIHAIAISHKQKNYVEPMARALSCFDSATFVFDKYDDGFPDEYIKQAMLDSDFIKVSCRGHGAGEARQLGLMHVLKKHPTADILFFDGDRIPTCVAPETIMELRESADIGLFPLTSDLRETRKRYQFASYGEFAELDFPLLNDNAYGGHIYNLDNYVYTCGIFISNEAIKMIKEVNEGFLFHPLLYGHWGFEDCVVGSIAKILGLKIKWFPLQLRILGKNADSKSPLLYAANYVVSKARERADGKLAAELDEAIRKQVVFEEYTSQVSRRNYESAALVSLANPTYSLAQLRCASFMGA